MRLLLIVQDARFRSLLRHHVTCEWPGAELVFRSTREADPLAPEFLAQGYDAVVIDHYIEGDGSVEGARTIRTALPAAMAAIDPRSTALSYRDAIVAIAREIMPGRVGISCDGFAGRFGSLDAGACGIGENTLATKPE